ncbi:MAG: hypothetical protein GXO58_07330 [Thermodesulfobacteria bacterium]|nr:hypothetical protein [Thermodesulfobacteriota bacterium]
MKKITYGHLAGALLLLSLLSGFIVAYQYEAATPFVSSVAIEAVLPFGSFFRSVHFWTSQLFVVMMVLHVIDLRHKVADGVAPRRLKLHWTIVALAVPIGIYALFSGYVLRYDATGQAAGAIAEHLFLRIPVFGEIIDKMLMNISGDGLNRLYAVHIFAGFVCWLLCTWYHLKRVRITLAAFGLALALTVVFCSMIRAPIDLPAFNAHLIKGPWFFLGIQELLRYFDPLVAGVIFPAVPLLVLFLLPWVRNSMSLYTLILMWTFAYSGVTLMSLLRSG